MISDREGNILDLAKLIDHIQETIESMNVLLMDFSDRLYKLERASKLGLTSIQECNNIVHQELKCRKIEYLPPSGTNEVLYVCGPDDNVGQINDPHVVFNNGCKL